MASSGGNTNASPHQRDENAGVLGCVPTTATRSPRRPSDRTVTSDCRSDALSTSASNRLVGPAARSAHVTGVSGPPRGLPGRSAATETVPEFKLGHIEQPQRVQRLDATMVLQEAQHFRHVVD